MGAAGSVATPDRDPTATRPKMRLFTRYLLRAHIGPFLFAFVALTGVVLINTLARQLAELAGRGLPMDVILRFFVLSLPSNIALTLPMAVLVSVLYTFSQLASENEVTALRASGIDLRRVMVPLLIAGALLSGGMTWFNSVVLPESNHHWSRLMVDIARKSPMLTLREQSVNEIRAQDGRSRYYLRAARIHSATNRLEDVVIYDRSQPDMGRTIYADSGSMAFNAAQTDLLLTLFDGHVREIDFNNMREFQRLRFGRQVLRMEGIGNELDLQSAGGYRSDREMTVRQLQERIVSLDERVRDTRRQASEAALRDLDAVLGNGLRPDESTHEAGGEGAEAAAGAAALARDGPGSEPAGTLEPLIDVTPELEMELEPEWVTVGETARVLRTQRSQNASSQRQIRMYRLEIHKKIALATAPFFFLLLGGPLAVRFPGGGVGVVIATSLSIFALYYVGLIGGETLVDEGYLSPVLAMWFMNGVLAVLGAYAFVRMGRETSTSRGGRSVFGAVLGFIRRRGR